MRDIGRWKAGNAMRDRITHHVTTLRVVTLGAATALVLLTGLFWAWRSARRSPGFRRLEGR